jgi:ATP-dependent DNA helicase PIF1
VTTAQQPRSRRTAHVCWTSDSEPGIDLPAVVFVRAPDYRGPTPYHDADGAPLVPIGPTTHTWTAARGVQCSRTQFPLSVAYAITVHKSQGLSLERVVVGLGAKDFSRGLSFVAISRARSLLGLAFAGPVTLERLTRKVDAKNRAREAAQESDARRRALLTLSAPSDVACAYIEETFLA